jgi:hypothetical protein
LPAEVRDAPTTRAGLEVSHLFTLEQVFDRSVLLLQERFGEVPPQDVARATALWIAGEARTELVLRELSSDWLAQTVSESPATVPEPPASSARVVDQQLHVSIVDAALAAWATPAGAPA